MKDSVRVDTGDGVNLTVQYLCHMNAYLMSESCLWAHAH